MRKSVVIILAACFSMMCWTTGCTDRKVSVAADSTATVADSSAEDSLEDLMDDVPMSKAVDELFDDFIFNFAGNRKMQLERVKFPLEVVTAGKKTLLDKKQWKTDRLFMSQGYYTLILDNRKQLELSKDTSLCRAVVEKINLESQTVKKYNFTRLRGTWMLTSIDNSDIVQNQNSSFLKFYERFATDFEFQKKSLNNPIIFTAPDPDDDFNMLTGDLLPEQWPDVGPTDLPSGTIYNIIYGQKYTESSQKVFLLRGIANGQELEMTFKKINGNWKLTRLAE